MQYFKNQELKNFSLNVNVRIVSILGYHFNNFQIHITLLTHEFVFQMLAFGNHRRIRLCSKFLGTMIEEEVTIKINRIRRII